MRHLGVARRRFGYQIPHVDGCTNTKAAAGNDVVVRFQPNAVRIRVSLMDIENLKLALFWIDDPIMGIPAEAQLAALTRSRSTASIRHTRILGPNDQAGRRSLKLYRINPAIVPEGVNCYDDGLQEFNALAITTH